MKKLEIEQGKFQSPLKRSRRIRSGNTLSATIAALKSEEEDGDDEEDVIDVDDPDNPCWQLYSSIKSATGAHGTLIHRVSIF